MNSMFYTAVIIRSYLGIPIVSVGEDTTVVVSNVSLKGKSAMSGIKSFGWKCINVFSNSRKFYDESYA